MYIYSLLLAVMSLVMPAMADIALGSLGTSYTASSTISLQWVDDGTTPKVDDLSTATILLCTGPNTSPHCFSSNPIASKKSVSDMDGEFKFDVSTISALGGDGAYFIQFTTLVADATGQYTIHYSSRFTLSGMTGSYAASGTGASPASEKHLTNVDADPVATGAALSSSIAIPYASQTGVIKYAPMQLQPGTTVTRALTPSARFPTSKVTLLSAFISPAVQISTVTPSWSYTFSQLTNYATAMPTPTQWYSASAVRASSIVAHAARRRKRWLDY